MFRRVLALVGLAALVLAATPVAALADGGPSDNYSSPAEIARANQKAQLVQQTLAAARMRNDPYYDYGQITMSLWQEPQATYAHNWCGPGSTTAVVGQWRGNAVVDNYPGGPDNYMAYLVNTLQEYDGVKTTFDKYVSVTNSEANTASFYVHSTYIGGLSHYTDMLQYDIQLKGHPLVNVVNANGLAGWTYDVAHFVNTKQYWIGGDTTTYGDTAGVSQGRVGDHTVTDPGWYLTSLANLYNNHIAPLTLYSFDQVVY